MEQRKRVNAKQTAKGEWQLDCTVEWTSDDADISTHKMDNIVIAADSSALLEAVEKQYRAVGRKIVGDAPTKDKEQS